MIVGKYLILACILFYNFASISACGCYGPTSCTATGLLCSDRSNDSCRCDCCPACNTCEQFFQFDCLTNRFTKHYAFSVSQSDILLKINETIPPEYIIDQTTGEPVRYLWQPCFRRSLPKDIYFIYEDDGRCKLVGMAKEKLEKTPFQVLFKGPVNSLVSVHFTITVV